MIMQEVTITNPTGLQVEAAGALCDLAMRFDCHVGFLYHGENEANAKSVLSILGAGVRKGETIILCCDGDDEKNAMDAINGLIKRGFNE